MEKKISSKILAFILVLTHWIAVPISAGNAFPINCGGSFKDFLNNFSSEAAIIGIPETTLEIIGKIKQDQKVLIYDRSQKSFKMSFIDFAERAVNDYRIKTGRKKIQKYSNLFDEFEDRYGIPSEVITAFWAMETDFGAVQGQFNTLNSLAKEFNVLN